MRVLNLTPTSQSFCDLLRRRRGRIIWFSPLPPSQVGLIDGVMGFRQPVAFLRGSSKLFGEMSAGSNQET